MLRGSGGVRLAVFLGGGVGEGGARLRRKRSGGARPRTCAQVILLRACCLWLISARPDLLGALSQGKVLLSEAANQVSALLLQLLSHIPERPRLSLKFAHLSFELLNPRGARDTVAWRMVVPAPRRVRACRAGHLRGLAC